MKLKLIIFILLYVNAITYSNSQELDSISMTFEDGLVVVKYDFLIGETGKDYELYLYGSHDNFYGPLQYTNGDVGKKIKVGTGKIIYWDAKKELGNFKGDFSLKIKGSEYTPFVSYININKDLKLKRGESFNINWTPSTKARNVILKIQRNGVPISDPMEVENSGTFTWLIPSNLKAGRGYTIQIVDTENLLKEETSESFSMIRKVPLTYKIIPAIAVVAVGALLLHSDKENGIPNPPGEPQ